MSMVRCHSFKTAFGRLPATIATTTASRCRPMAVSSSPLLLTFQMAATSMTTRTIASSSSSWSTMPSSSSARYLSTTVSAPDPPTSNHLHEALVGKVKGEILYTETDEAPALATYSLYPVIRKFAALGSVDIIPCDISLAGRVLAAFPEMLNPEQRVPNNLSYLGQRTLQPDCSIVKLPNISAPINQLQDCIAELRSKGYNVPLFPTDPKTAEQKSIQERYNKLAGSAVNPVLREGNSDRRVAPPVKAYAQKNPHRMGLWSKASRTHVAHMSDGDFYATEVSKIIPKETSVEILFDSEATGERKILKAGITLHKDQVVDASFISVKKLQHFYRDEIQDAKELDLLLSLHLKATMMKISDPVLFGHCIKVFYEKAYDKHESLLREIGANPNSGLGSMYEVIKAKLPAAEADAVIADFEACYEDRPWLAMVNSDKGITNLHAPNDIIIDASMPVVVRDSGKMWNKLNELEDVKCLIPDRCYATMYQEVISYVKTHGQFDVATMGNVANVGLMAQKAEEYGSHDKTFELPADGFVRVIDEHSNEVLFEHKVEQGDVWRMCLTEDIAIRDWVKLAVNRTRATGSRTIFWLDKKRAHDARLIEKVNMYLDEHDTAGLDISIIRPVDAVRISMERATNGKDTISVTGNVLRDYLTDLFPILELGTSAKMLSIVPLLAGGGLYETGAGGSAPKHVQQFVKEGHLRWDSLGEYLALAVAFERLAETANNPKAKLLGQCLNKAVGRILTNRKGPARVASQLDNRATNFYIALYWSDFLHQQDPAYAPVFEALTEKRTQIVEELKATKGQPQDLGGYYLFDPEKIRKAMNPSTTFNEIMDSIGPKV